MQRQKSPPCSAKRQIKWMICRLELLSSLRAPTPYDGLLQCQRSIAKLRHWAGCQNTVAHVSIAWSFQTVDRCCLRQWQCCRTFEIPRPSHSEAWRSSNQTWPGRKSKDAKDNSFNAPENQAAKFSDSQDSSDEESRPHVGHWLGGLEFGPHSLVCKTLF